MVAGCGADLLVNICLTLLGYIPGHSKYLLPTPYDPPNFLPSIDTKIDSPRLLHRVRLFRPSGERSAGSVERRSRARRLLGSCAEWWDKGVWDDLNGCDFRRILIGVWNGAMKGLGRGSEDIQDYKGGHGQVMLLSDGVPTFSTTLEVIFVTVNFSLVICSIESILF